MPDKIQLIIGSKYKITSLESRDKPLITNGTFKGYTIIGESDAICIELDKSHKELAGKLRIIPSHMIVSIDVIEVAEEKKEREEEIERYLR